MTKMELACEAVVPNLGCDFVARGNNSDEVHAAMMTHGGETHSNLVKGETTEQMQQARQGMAAHIRQLLEASSNS